MHMTTGIARYMRRTRRPTSPPIPTRSPRSNELPIARQRAEKVEKAKEKGQGKGGGRGYGGGPGPDRRVGSIEEVAEDMLRTLEELKAQQRGGQSLSGSQQEGAAGSHV